MRYSLLAGGKRIRPVLTLATASCCGARPARVLPVGRRLRAHPHLLADPRRPARHRRRHAASRPAHLPRGLRRGHRHPGRRRAVRRSLPPAAADRQAGRARGACSAAAAEIARATGVQGMVGGQYMDVAGVGPHGRRPARAARAQDGAPHRGGRGVRRPAFGRGARGALPRLRGAGRPAVPDRRRHPGRGRRPGRAGQERGQGPRAGQGHLRLALRHGAAPRAWPTRSTRAPASCSRPCPATPPTWPPSPPTCATGGARRALACGRRAPAGRTRPYSAAGAAAEPGAILP